MTQRIEVQISSTLSDEDWKTLRAFCDKARRLAQTKLVSGGESHIHGQIRFEQGKGLWFETKLPPEEQVSEFLMAFRFFYLQNEPTYFPKVLGILGRHSLQDEARQALKVFRRQWEHSLFKDTLKITLNEKQITSAVLMDLWFNAHYFHADEDKGPELEKLKEVFSQDFAKYMLLDAAYEATRVVSKIYDGVYEIVEKKLVAPKSTEKG